MPLYVYLRQDGAVYDFFDFTWNVDIRSCVAPFTLRDNMSEHYAELRNATLLRVSTI